MKLFIASLVTFCAIGQVIPNPGSSGGGGGGGTVTHTAGALTDGHVMLGAGSADSKISDCTQAGNGTALTCPGGFAATPDGTHAQIMSLVGNTTAPSIPTNSFGFIAPNSASFTSWVFQPSSTAPTVGQFLKAGTPAGGIIPLTTAAIAQSDLPTPISAAAATTHTMTAPYEVFYCTTATACSVTLPAPVALPTTYQFCVRMDNNVSATITLAGITNVYYELPAKTGYGTVSAALVSTGAAVTNQICISNRDATHYVIWSSTGF